MNPYQIITYPNEILNKTCEPVTEFGTEELRMIVQRMHATIKHRNSPGIGLAANQVGILKRIIVVNTLQKKAGGYLGALINPEIISNDGDMKQEAEGCLSFPNQRYEVYRPQGIKVRFFNIDGQETVRSFKGITAICIQHEIDHLNGTTIADVGSRVEK